MEATENKKGSLASGWILVTLLLLLCLLGTGLTWWNYSQHVFSSAQGVVLEAQGKEGFVSVCLPSDEARKILNGHLATITLGEDNHPLKGRVVSMVASKDVTAATVLIRVMDAPTPWKAGEACGVTIDTTVPPVEETH